jgi:hypothetical protein
MVYEYITNRGWRILVPLADWVCSLQQLAEAAVGGRKNFLPELSLATNNDSNLTEILSGKMYLKSTYFLDYKTCQKYGCICTERGAQTPKPSYASYSVSYLVS